MQNFESIAAALSTLDCLAPTLRKHRKSLSCAKGRTQPTHVLKFSSRDPKGNFSIAKLSELTSDRTFFHLDRALLQMSLQPDMLLACAEFLIGKLKISVYVATSVPLDK
jgi:hypothetical protein